MSYPATVDVRTPEHMENWRSLGQCVLALPHLLVAGALDWIADLLGIVSWFAILFTGRLPDGIARIQVVILRYTLRVWTYAGFLHENYPPFDFTDESEDSPVQLTVRPQLEDRDRLTVGLRFLWVIPALLFAFVISVVGILCWILAFFDMAFTGLWAQSLRSGVMMYLRVFVRLRTYTRLLTDTYPPFSTD